MVQPTTTNGDIAVVESYEDEVNNLGDQDAETTGYQYPPDAYTPTAQNVRRYPELFDQSVIDSFNIPNEDHQEPTAAEELDVTTVDENETTEPESATRVTFE